MIRAQIYKERDTWFLKLEGPTYEVRDLLEALEVHSFRLISYGGKFPLDTMWATLVPRARYPREEEWKTISE